MLRFTHDKSAKQSYESLDLPIFLVKHLVEHNLLRTKLDWVNQGGVDSRGSGMCAHHGSAFRGGLCEGL